MKPFFFFCFLLCAVSAFAATIEVFPTTLHFGQVIEGTRKTLRITVLSKDEQPVSVRLNIPSFAPFSFDRNSKSFTTSLSPEENRSIDMDVVVSSSTPLGAYSSEMEIYAGTNKPIRIPLSVKVVRYGTASPTFDLIVSSRLRSNAVARVKRRFSVNVTPFTTAKSEIKAATAVFQTNCRTESQCDPEMKINQTLIYKTSRLNPVVYTAEVPLTIAKVILRYVVDPDDKIPETEENNNVSMLSICFDQPKGACD